MSESEASAGRASDGDGGDGLPQHHGPWRIKQSRVVYEDAWMRVRRDEVIRPDGDDGSYATVRIKPGVCVLAVDDSDRVHLTEEFHYAVGRTTIEAVSGGIEPGSSPEETAHRELKEELGITASRLRRVGEVDPFTASVLSPTSLFVATGITVGDDAPEGTELIRPKVLPFAEAIEAVTAGVITHAPTCVLLLRLAVERLQRV